MHYVILDAEQIFKRIKNWLKQIRPSYFQLETKNSILSRCKKESEKNPKLGDLSAISLTINRLLCIIPKVNYAKSFFTEGEYLSHNLVIWIDYRYTIEKNKFAIGYRLRPNRKNKNDIGYIVPYGTVRYDASPANLFDHQNKLNLVSIYLQLVETFKTDQTGRNLLNAVEENVFEGESWLVAFNRAEKLGKEVKAFHRTIKNLFFVNPPQKDDKNILVWSQSP